MRVADFFATPLKIVGSVLAIAALGVGIVLGVNYLRTREAKSAIESAPAIVANTKAIDTAKAAQVLTSGAYHSAVGGFRNFAGTVRGDPHSSPTTLACVDSTEKLISKCDARHASDTTLIALYRTRAELMEEEAVRARRGKFFAPFVAGGYEPLKKLGAGRVGADLNFSDKWSVTGTFDEALRIERVKAGRMKTSFEPSAFVGVKYHFGGRH